jgi:hypothetical protein
MSNDNNNGIREIDIIIQLTRLEAKLDAMGDVRDVAKDSLASSKSAHLRIDKIDRIIFWAGTIIIGALATGAISLLFQL